MKYFALILGLAFFNISVPAYREPSEASRQIWERIAARITSKDALLGYVDPEVAHIGRDPWQHMAQPVPVSNDPEIEFTGTMPRKP